MNGDELLCRRIVVGGAALIYWGGVFVQARRIRKRIGRSPNLKPRGAKECLLWAGWMLVVGAWIGQPLFVGRNLHLPGFQINESLLLPASLATGLALTIGGYAATLWCYRIMGNAWRIGINRQEKNQLVTRGPYQWIRHPIYAFQAVMLAGGILLLPTLCSFAILLIHLACVLAKARDEETYLLGVHGNAYRDYLARTGRLFPKLW